MKLGAPDNVQARLSVIFTYDLKAKFSVEAVLSSVEVLDWILDQPNFLQPPFLTDNLIQAIINLAGEQILSIKARTSPAEFQHQIRESRIGTAKICAEICNERATTENPIETFIQV